MPRMYATGSPVALRSISVRYTAAWSAPTGASGMAISVARSARTTCPSSSSASSRAVSEPLSRSESVPSLIRAPTVAHGDAVAAGSSEFDDDVQVTRSMKDLDRDRTFLPGELEVNQAVPDAQITHPQLGE